MSPDRGAIAASPRAERAMQRMRNAVYVVLAVLAVGALISAAAVVTVLSKVERLTEESVRQGNQLTQQGEDLRALLAADAEERAGRAARLKEALERVKEQFVANDEADARRLEELRQQVIARIDAIACAPGTPAPRPRAPLPPLTRRLAFSPVPVPIAPPPPPPEPPPPPPSPVLLPQQEPCVVDLLGLCVAL